MTMKILVYVEVQAGQVTGASLELIAGARQLAGANGTVALASFGIQPPLNKQASVRTGFTRTRRW